MAPAGGFRGRGGRGDDFADEDEDELLAWEQPSYKDMILWLIDGSASMHDAMVEVPGDGTDERGEPTTKKRSLFWRSLDVAFKLQRLKLLSSPNDQVGILIFNTEKTDVPSVGKGVAYPHCTALQRIAQVDPPVVGELRRDLEAAEEDPDFLRRKYEPCAQQMRIHHALGNAEAMLSVGKAGSKRVFFVTNVDDPFADKPGKDKMQKLCVQKVQSMAKRGIEFEPFMISSGDQAFDTRKFYGDIFSLYDDDDYNVAPAPAGNDASTYTRRSGNAATKFQDLESEVTERGTPKRVVFRVTMSLGHGVTMGVKGYNLVQKATKGVPVRTVPREEDGIVTHHEIHVETQLHCADTGRQLSKAEVVSAFQFGSDTSMRSRVTFTAAEMRALRTYGQRPGIKLLGFKPRSELGFHENVKHSYFIYPSDEVWRGSQRAFAALLRTMSERDLMGVALFVPRDNVMPAFVAVLPQMEERDDDGQQEPPGMHLVTLPFADDVRSPPEKLKATLDASQEEVEAARAVVTRYSRKAAFHPDLYFNPALKHHYDSLMAEAFGDPKPDPATMPDKTIPMYDVIEERTGHLISAWNDIISDRAPAAAAAAGQPAEGAVRTSRHTRPADFGAQDEALLREYHVQGCIGRFVVAKLRAACDYYRLAKTGKKLELVERLVNHLDRTAAQEQMA